MDDILNNDIYNNLLKEVELLYKKYSYLNISKEIITDKCADEIIKSKNKYNDKETYLRYLKRRIEASIILLGMELFCNVDDAFNITSNYINDNFNQIDNYNQALFSLKEISKLFSKYNYLPDPNLIIELLNENQTFLKILELIVNKNLDSITNGKLEKYFNDNNIIMMIGIYCMVNNIKIISSDDSLEEDDFFINDDTTIYYKEISRIPPLSYEETKELNLRIKNGDNEAKKRFIEANLKLVVKTARRLYNSSNKLHFLDLVQAGNIGLIKAVEKYDVTMGYRFSTYATWWITTDIVREIQNNGKTIRIPVHTHQKINAYNQKKEKLEQLEKREILPEEVAKKMNISSDDAYKYERIQEEPLSINYLTGENQDSEIVEIIGEDDFMDSVEAHCLSEEVQELLKKCKLTLKEFELLALRYGFYDGKVRTLEEVGEMRGVVREAIRRAEAKALYKLRIYEGTKDFIHYMDNPDRAVEILKRLKKVYRENPKAIYKSNPLGDDSFGYNIVKH